MGKYLNVTALIVLACVTGWLAYWLALAVYYIVLLVQA